MVVFYFFHEVEESSVWLHEDLQRLYASFKVTPIDGNYVDGQRLMEQLQVRNTKFNHGNLRSDMQCNCFCITDAQYGQS